MTRISRLAVVALSLTLGGCATLTVGSFNARFGNFTRYHTYDWVAADSLPTGDPRLDGNAIFDDHFRGAVERALESKGYELSGRELPDLLVHYHVVVRQRVDDTREGAVGALAEYPPRVVATDVVTFVVDLVDRRTENLVWRGWAETDADLVLRSQDWMARTVDRAVTKMVSALPPVHDLAN